MFAERHGRGFDEHVLEGDLHRAHLVHLGAGGHGIVHGDLHGQEEMRRAVEAFAEPPGDHLAHLRVRRIDIAFLACDHRNGCCGRRSGNCGCGCGCGCRGRRGCGHKSVDIATHDAATVTGTGHLADIDAFLCRKFAGEGRCFQSSLVIRRNSGGCCGYSCCGRRGCRCRSGRCRCSGRGRRGIQRGQETADVGAFFSYDGDDAVDLGGFSFRHANVQQGAFGIPDHFHSGLVGFHIREVIVALYFVAHLLVPLHDLTLGHRVTEQRHPDDRDAQLFRRDGGRSGSRCGGNGGRGSSCSGCRRGGRCTQQAGNIFALFTDDGDDLIHFGGIAFLNPHIEQGAFSIAHDFHRGLVRFDIGQAVVTLDLVAHFLIPLDDLSFGHRIAEEWHPYDFGHGEEICLVLCT